MCFHCTYKVIVNRFHKTLRDEHLLYVVVPASYYSDSRCNVVNVVTTVLLITCLNPFG